MQNTTQSPLCNAAIAYATRGFAVFPCVPRGKVPATPHGCRDATQDLAQITTWWRESPYYNVAVATGPVSRVFVLDVDGLDAEASLRKLEQQYGALPETVESITPRGRHIFFSAKMATSGTVPARLPPASISAAMAAMRPATVHSPEWPPVCVERRQRRSLCRSARLAQRFAYRHNTAVSGARPNRLNTGIPQLPTPSATARATAR